MVLGASRAQRNREFQRLRAELISDFTGKKAAQVRLRPQGRVALEWTRLETGVVRKGNSEWRKTSSRRIKRRNSEPATSQPAQRSRPMSGAEANAGGERRGPGRRTRRRRQSAGRPGWRTALAG